ncbi:putative zinc-binding oxidoreductase [Phaeosphaeria sp. MPI-PUGE-AT-0046c]|nr:putative zinc-binding oxidoreductase [Phaeosphaeria sp. MPI-PUGE-AT-0046c]
MRALIRTRPSKELKLDLTQPEPASEDHPNRYEGRNYIIQTKAVALCRGELDWPEPLEAPGGISIPGFDVAGVVLSCPGDTSRIAFQPGDEVYALTNPHLQGNARQVTIAEEHELALKPKNLTWPEAAAVPLSALTAFQGLFVHGNLHAPGRGDNKGQRVLVTAASGGVGIWAVQMARQAGAHVVGTCGTTNVDFVNDLGADVVLDYTKTEVLDWVKEDQSHREFDLVLDCIGGATLTKAWRCAKKNGKVISVAEPADPKRPREGVAEGVTSVWFIVDANQTQLREITNMIEKGLYKSQVDSVFPLDQWREAFLRLEGGHAKGKVVLEL